MRRAGELTRVAFTTFLAVLGAPLLEAQTPDPNWVVQSAVADCSGTSSYPVAEPGNGCQSYALDLYENWDPSSNGAGDTDLESFSVGADASWFYFRFRTRTDWNSDGTGESQRYQIELETDFATEARSDVMLDYSPRTTHSGATWVAEGDSRIKTYQDSDNDVGGANLTASEFPCGGCDGYDANLNLSLTDAYARIVTDSSLPLIPRIVVEIALRRSVIGAPSVLRSRPWSSQLSALGRGEFLFHDARPSSDLSGNRFDNILTADTATWLQSGPGATWVLLSRLHAGIEAGAPVVEWETAAEAGTVGFRLYRVDLSRGVRELAHEGILPASHSTAGARYRYVDGSAIAAPGLAYELVEVASAGSGQVHGPVPVDAAAPAAEGLFGACPGCPYQVQPHQPEARTLRRLTAAQGPLGMSRSDAAARSGGRTKAKIAVGEDGIQRISSQELADVMGLSASDVEHRLRTGKLRLTTQGREVAWMASTRGKDLLFYGEGANSPYTRQNVYWLETERGSTMALLRGRGPQPPAGGSFPETAVLEQDRIPLLVLDDDPGADYWYWEVVVAGDSAQGQKSFPFRVESPETEPALAELSVRFRGAIDGIAVRDHLALVLLNGVELGEVRWAGTQRATGSFRFDPGLLAAGDNLLEIRGELLPGVEQSVFFVDGFDLRYRRAYRATGDQLRLTPELAGTVTVTGFSTPQIRVFELANTRRPREIGATTIDAGAEGYRVSFRARSPGIPYVAVAETAWRSPDEVWPDSPSRLRAASHEIDYLVIAPSALCRGAAALAAYRESQGLRTLVVDLEDVYDTMNHGVASPEAVRSFLALAVERWRTPPRYAVLVGAGTFDYLDHLGYGGNLIPALMVRGIAGLSPSDTAMGDVGGDGVLEVAVGRLPVHDELELAAYLDKLRSAEGRQGGSGVAIMTADDADNAGQFATDAERLLARLARDGFAVDRIYLGAPYGTEEARARLFAAIQQGAALMGYVGHAGLDRLASEGLLRSDDVSSLPSDGLLPLLAAVTCYVNFFALPGFDSLGEELVLHPTAGAASVWSATGLSFNGPASELAQGLFAALASPNVRVGDAMIAAAKRFRKRGGDPLLIHTYSLLGDPALSIRGFRQAPGLHD